MLREILPEVLWNALKDVPLALVQEIRLRVGKPICVYDGNSVSFITQNGLTHDENMALIARKININEILTKCSNNALYSINDQLVNGYISVAGGIRVGVSGEVVASGNSVQTLKNITSLNIRIPHEVKNCSLPIFNQLVKPNHVCSTLILSAPGMGKTTFIRDLAYQISTKLPMLNTLIVDERAEITGISGGVYAFESINADVYTNCSKSFGFNCGIRSMRPNVIITDEIDIDRDLDVIVSALTCGVSVIATIHADSITELKNKSGFKKVLDMKLFERYVVLGNDNGVGTIMGVYNSNMSCIYI